MPLNNSPSSGTKYFAICYNSGNGLGTENVRRHCQISPPTMVVIIVYDLKMQVRHSVFVLNQKQVKDLERLHTEYRKYPKLIQEFYQLVKDFSDTKSMELAMDYSWSFETRLVSNILDQIL